MKNVNYILRDDACLKFDTIHLPEIESKIDARSYAAMRELEEELMPQRGAGTPRNHHRMMITMPDETDPEQAMTLAKNFMEREFPGTRSIIAIHQSENGIGLHSHVWIEARKLNGKKLDLGTKYTKLDKLYSKLYDQTYGTNYTAEFAAARKFNAENEVSTYPKQLKILVEAQERNEQRGIVSGKHIVKRAGSAINDANRKIDELQQFGAYGNELELARIGRAGSEQKRRDNDPTRLRPVPNPNSAEARPAPHRSRRS
jgi:hypothetical protein